MLNIPMLKLEKNNVYLNTQLEQQENNKQLMLDIISNIDLILNKNTNDTENYKTIRESAYSFLNTISNNITSLEQLNIEIAGISKELENLQSEENKNTRTKEFYIVSFSNIKNSIAQYTEKFQNLQKKLDLDNNNFNEFINVNNFKYNFESVENEEGSNSNTYKFTGFSIETNNDDTVLEEPTLETFNKAVTDDIEVTSEIENEVVNEEPFLEETVENILEEITETAPIGNVQEDISTNFFENNTELTSITGDDSEQNNKIDELTNNFRKMLINLANEDSNVEDTSNLISNYFKEIHELADAEIKKENEITTKEIEENTLEEVQNVSEDIEPLEDAIEDIEVTEDVIENTEEILEPTEDVQEDVETINNIINVPQNTKETVENTTNEFTGIDEVEETLVEENPENEYTEEFFEKPYEKIDEAEEINEIEDVIDIPQTNLGYDFGVRNPFNNNFENSENISLPIEEKNEEEIQKELLKNKLEKIITATADNETLIISEKTNNIYLPYKIPELINYIDNYPDAYSSLSDVVAQEFILPFDYFMKHPYKSRFFETYNLLRNRQGNSVFSSITAGLKLMPRNDLNPAIIASCKSEDELKTYLYYLDANRLDEFKAFNIIYQVNPL